MSSNSKLDEESLRKRLEDVLKMEEHTSIKYISLYEIVVQRK